MLFRASSNVLKLYKDISSSTSNDSLTTCDKGPALKRGFVHSHIFYIRRMLLILDWVYYFLVHQQSDYWFFYWKSLKWLKWLWNRCRWSNDEEEDNLKTKYGSHWNSEAEIKLPPLPSIPTTKFGSTSGNDERHLGPVISDKPGSKYGIGTKNSAPTSTLSKKGSFANLLSSSSSVSITSSSSFMMTPNPRVQILDVL